MFRRLFLSAAVVLALSIGVVWADGPGGPPTLSQILAILLYPNNTTTFLRGDGTWAAPAGSSANYSLASGFVNKLRNSALNDWFHGTSITVTTSGGWSAEGVYAVPTGASITASQVTNPLTSPLSYYGLKLLGAASNTDVKTRFVLESYDAAPLAGQTVTFQLQFQNKSGASITPTLATNYPTTQDGGVTGGAAWGAKTADLAATNMQACANNATCTEAYTLTVNASANLGYEFVVDFGALVSTDYVVIGGGFDARATPGVSTGLNSAPPTPEIPTAEAAARWDKRFYQCTYDNGVAPGASTHVGLADAGNNGGNANSAAAIVLPVAMRSDPAASYWDGAGTANKGSGYSSGSYTDSNVSVTPVSTGQNDLFFTFSSASGSQLVHYCADATISGG